MAALKSLFSRKTKVPKKQGQNQQQREIKPSEEFKIVVMGPGAAGKSALVIRYITDGYEETYDPTMEDSYRKSELIDETGCTLDILDTAGQEEFIALRDQWIRESKVYVLVYSVIHDLALEEISTFSKHITRIRDEIKDDIGVVFVANKIDLPVDEHEISFDDGKKAALKFSKESGVRTSFIQTSAKLSINVKQMFVEAVNLLCGGPGNLNLIEPLDLSKLEDYTEKPRDTSVKTGTDIKVTAEEVKSDAGGSAESTTATPTDLSLYVLKSDFDEMSKKLTETQTELEQTRKELSDLKALLKQRQII